jgi:hypothetical protein
MASRERHDAMAGLLKRNLVGDAGAGKDCPEPDILAAYFERSLDADETAHIELHLSECARCRDQLAALGRAEEAATMPAMHAPRHQPRASWLWDWRWLAPVAAVLVIAAVWATRRPELTRIAEQPTSAVATPQPALQAPPVQEKKQAVSRVAPAPVVVPSTPKIPPQRDSITVNSVEREKTAEVERSPLQTPQSSKSVQDLPLVSSNYRALNSMSKKAPEPQRKSAEDAATAPPPATNESVTVESQAETVQSSAAGAPLPPKAENGVPAGVVGGAIAPAQGVAPNASPKASRSTASAQPTAASGSSISVERSPLQQLSGPVEVIQMPMSGGFTPLDVPPGVVRTPDPRVLWRIRIGGFVDRSEDGGVTWKGKMPRRNASYTAGSALSANVCWLVGRDGIILLTQDGKHWQTIPPPLRTDFVAIAARDAWTATVTTADGRKFITTNQGESWTLSK